MKEISVLMVDNNERFLTMAKEYISEQEFVKDVFVTASDAEALRFAAEKKPDLILLDVLMPGRNGIDLIPSFREKSPKSKIIMLTLWDMNGYRDSARSAGADDFVTKRAMTETLLPAMKKAAAMA
jgi:DNA-binding NarL/FixJ family response regulator